VQKESIATQCQAEFASLTQIKEALRVTLNWRAPSVGLSRKISSVLFVMRALQRHLEHQLTLEEQGGYMEIVRESMPSLYDQAVRLREQHDSFREELDAMVSRIQHLGPSCEDEVDQVCYIINDLLRHIELHEREEADLLQEALIQDVGGEG
jgi:hypothetical protein